MRVSELALALAQTNAGRRDESRRGTRGRVRHGVVLTLVLAPLLAAQDHPCGGCHEKESASQPHTNMAKAITTAGQQQVLKKHPKWELDANGFHYTVEAKDGINMYTVSDGANSMTLPIRYAFGVGGAGQTFVFEYEGRFYESMASYYAGLDRLAVTVGSEKLRPKTLVEAMGRLESDDEAARCFNCHSTTGVIEGKVNLETMRPGLQCERCHPGANAHREALNTGKEAAMPEHLGGLSAEDMAENCGSCHRTWETVLRMRTWGEVNVRFQPYRLANSKCFLGNDARIKCTACHDPHTELVRDDATYDSKCQACHGNTQKTCTVAEKNCVSCHMPKVELPGSYSVFTDHQIRIVRAGDRYPN